MKWKAVFMICLMAIGFVHGQDNGAILNIDEEPSVRQLLDHRKALNFHKDRKLKVWSVQLLLSRDKYLATQKISQIKKNTQNLSAKIDWFYEAPYYRIYAGGYYTKLEAVTLLNKLMEDYPDAIVFKNTEARPSDVE